jgi:hypothetical protein
MRIDVEKTKNLSSCSHWFGVKVDPGGCSKGGLFVLSNVSEAETCVGIGRDGVEVIMKVGWLDARAGSFIRSLAIRLDLHRRFLEIRLSEVPQRRL